MKPRELPFSRGQPIPASTHFVEGWLGPPWRSIEKAVCFGFSLAVSGMQPV
jgi:hypothetical protein